MVVNRKLRTGVIGVQKSKKIRSPAQVGQVVAVENTVVVFIATIVVFI